MTTNLEKKIDELIKLSSKIEEWLHAGLDNSIFLMIAISDLSNKLHELNEELFIKYTSNKSYKPKVKQLQWVEDTYGISGLVNLGDNAEMDYYITNRDDPAPGEIVREDENVELTIDGQHYHRYFASIEEAQQAAQNHFEALIISCLE